MKKTPKILIIRFSAIGDIVLTTPIIRCLKKQLIGSEIHFCTKKQNDTFISTNPYLDKVHFLENSLSDLIKRLKAEKFDYIIDLHNNLRTRVIKARLWNAKSYTFNKLNWKKFLYVRFKMESMPNKHVVDRYFDTVKKLGVTNDNEGLDYFIPEKDEVEKNWLPETHQGEYVVFAIGGSFATKRLPTKKIIEVCDKINQPIILLGGKDDSIVANEIEKFFDQSNSTSILEEALKVNFNKKTVIFNGCGKFNLNQSAFLAKNSRAVFTHDTGMLHISAAFKKEIFSIWGNTTPELGFYPYQTKFTIFEVKNLACRPCSKLGHDQCPKGHFKCMNNIKFDFYLP